ncbi:Protein RTM1 [Colletotrichum tanaceti]|uniref:Protein RTM1 n=1 Tax=Colletotrichum tanaceti TaxID=1306861 RepID=A0A4U6X3H5_9PEZI|nr:Protein RTM1 [Colletotrichum tanaceti]TKW49463.1 Protein RTM1 [Colletotrichum tanaceti]
MADNSTTTEGASEGFIFYHYDPSMVAATLFIIVFGVSGILHVWQLCQRRTWYFIPFGRRVLEAVGYVGRSLSAAEAPDYTKNPYIIQSILLLLGPALFAASIYMVLGRLIDLLDAGHHSLIGPKWLTKVFVFGDVLSFFAQGGGGGMLATAKDRDSVKKGENIIVGGLVIQILFFGFFMVVTLVFHVRLARGPTSATRAVQTPPWRGLLWVLYGSSLLIMARSLFRVAEYVEGSEGKLPSREVYIYVFDGLLMAVTALLFNWFHPSRVINAEAAGLKQVTSSEVLSEGYLMESGQYRNPQHQRREKYPQSERYEPYQGAGGQQGFRR